VDFVIGKTGPQGISYITGFNQQVYDFLTEQEWPLIETWPLPDASEARLWQNPNR